MTAAALCVAGGCGDQGAAPGPCGPVLSAAECGVVSGQLGSLSQWSGTAVVPDPPPPDPTNIAGRSDNVESAAAVLGKLLFFDPCLSQDQVTPCAACHDYQAGFIDSRLDAHHHRVQASPGSSTVLPADPTKVAYTLRNSPSLYNVAYGNVIPQFDRNRGAGVTWGPWDGRYDSLWALTAEVFEFGNTNRADRTYIAYRIVGSMPQPGPEHEAYVNTFGSLPMNWFLPHHGTPSTAVSAAYAACWNGTDSSKCVPMLTSFSAQDRATVNTIFYNAGKALSAYLRQLRSGASAYDRWLLEPGSTALSEPAQRGLRLFVGKAECVLCHSGPNFTDERFHNLGVPVTDVAMHTGGSSVPQQATPQPVVNPACLPGASPSPACPDWGHYGWENKISGQCAGSSCQKSNTATCVSSFSDAMDKPTQCLPLSSYDPCSASPDPDACLSTLLCSTAPAPQAGQQDCATAYTACTRAEDKIGCLQGLAQSRGTDLPCPAYDAGSCAQRSAGRCAPATTMNSMGQMTTLCIPAPPATDIGTFKTPSLRNVARTWPYMHNGSIADYGPQDQGLLTAGDDPSTPHLLAVVEFYNQGGGTPAVGSKDPLLRQLHLTPSEKQDLVEFLQSLTDESVGQGDLGKSPWPAMTTCPN